MNARTIVVQAWQVRPSHLETAAAVLGVCLGNLVFGFPVLISGIAVVGFIAVVSLFTAYSELRFEQEDSNAAAEAQALTRDGPE